MTWIGIIFLVVILLTVIFGYVLSGPGYAGSKTDHFDGKRFTNPNGLAAQNLWGVLKYGIYRKPERWTKDYETDIRIEAIPEPKQDEVQISFVNHSTFLIQAGGLNILTDPVWSKRCSPFQWVGPERMRPPGFSIDLLPKIDIVLLSHNHYDHLDVNTIKTINQKHKPKFIAPLGVGKFLSKLGVTESTELDWGQTEKFKSCNIKGIPANHFSSRGLFDRDKTLWCGYLLKFGDYKIYFLGDSGYGPNFKKLGEEEGNIDLAMIPIGAYLPKWFMSPIHISPEEAVQVHQDVKAKQSIAMHFGTFPLADDGMETPIKELRTALAKSKLSEDEFMVPDEGGVYTFNMSTGTD